MPEETDALLELHMDVIGTIDLSERTVMVVAAQHDWSFLKTLQLSGGMAMYGSFGDLPYFLHSVGGSHPVSRPAACRRLQPRHRPVDRRRGRSTTEWAPLAGRSNLADRYSSAYPPLLQPDG